MILDSSPNNFASGYRPLLYNFTSTKLDATIRTGASLIKAGSLNLASTPVNFDGNDVALIQGLIGSVFLSAGSSITVLSGTYKGVHLIKWVSGKILGLDVKHTVNNSNISWRQRLENHFAEVTIETLGADDSVVNRPFNDDGTFKIDIQKYLQVNFSNNINDTSTNAVTDNQNQLTNIIVVDVKEFADDIVDGEIVSIQLDSFDGFSDRKFFSNAIRQYIELLDGEVRKTIEDKIEAEYVATNLVPSSSRFLTDAPRGRVFIDSDSPYQLSVLYDAALVLTSADFKIEFFDSSGSSISVITKNVLTPTTSMTIGCGTSNLTIPANTVFYEVWLIDDATNIITEKFRIDIVDKCDNLFNRFYWQNQKGGFDGFIFRGEESKSTGFKKQKSKRSFADTTTTLPEANFKTFQTEVEESFQVNSGWVLRKDIEWLEQMAYSNNVFEWMPELSQYVPIIIESQKITLDDNRAATFNLQLTYKRAFEKIIQDA